MRTEHDAGLRESVQSAIFSGHKFVGDEVIVSEDFDDSANAAIAAVRAWDAEHTSAPVPEGATLEDDLRAIQVVRILLDMVIRDSGMGDETASEQLQETLVLAREMNLVGEDDDWNTIRAALHREIEGKE